MALALCVVLLAATLPQVTPQSTESFPIGDVRNCPATQRWGTNAPLYRITALPGSGFDNLRNLDMGEVFFFNYSTCKISNDGKYLLPDNISLSPILESKIDLYSEFFDHWDDYTSMTSSSINHDVGTFFSQIGGKFSSEYGTIKSRQVGDNAKTARAMIKSRLYTVKLQPFTQLHPAFKSRLVAIANSLLNNDSILADYLSELLVRDYGTHYVTTVDVGGVLSQIDHLDSSYVYSQSQDTSKLAASVGVDFLGKLSIAINSIFSSGTTNQTGYQQNRKSSCLITMGGPPYRANFTLQYWEDGLQNALVATDRSGNPLHFCITPTLLTDLPPSSILQTANSVFNAINRYYKVNTRYGCTDPGSKNFNFHANLDDNSCGMQSTNFTFGGLFQTCWSQDGYNDSCNDLSQVNPLTGRHNCPNGYTPVRLRSGTTTRTRYVTVCNRVCSSCGFLYLYECCDCHGVGQNVQSTFQYQAYWCVALGPVPQSEGYLFGGVYTSTSPNPVTGASRCPTYFTPLSMAQDINVCVSVDVEMGYKYSLPFAGFDSCEIGNPLAATGANGYPAGNPSDWPNQCPQGYTQHMITVDNGCEINYCVQLLSGKGLLVAQLPPFGPVPQPKFNMTKTLVVGDYDGEVWVKGQDGTWSKSAQGGTGGLSALQKLADANHTASCNSTTTVPLPQDNAGSSSLVSDKSGAPSSSELSSGEVAAASVGSLIGAGLVIATMLLFGKIIHRKYTKQQSRRGEIPHTQSVGDDSTTQYSRLVVNNNNGAM